MKLNELYENAPDVEITGIKINSKEINKGDLFICTMGATVDRHNFIKDAIKKGAKALIVSKEVDASIPYVKIENTNKELPKIARKFYNHPENRMNVIGVTGTDGKTTTTTVIQTLLGSDKCAYMGTNGRSCAKFSKTTANTTPGAEVLYGYLDEFINAGCDTIAMEASSEAFYNGRLEGMPFLVGAITNVTSEHLNTHKTFENYLNCKCKLFDQIRKDGYAILNKDDEHFNEVLSHCKCKVLTYGRDESCNLYIKDFKIFSDKTLITFVLFGKTYEVTSPLLGDFNVYNLACALLSCVALGKKMEDLIPNISKINVSGRLDMLPNIGQDFYCMVDYAHTPNAIDKILNFVHTLGVNKSIVVNGSAGERDHTKRPQMAEAVLKNASYAIFTYEDPRSEDPLEIIKEMTSTVKGVYNNYEVIVDRRQAIRRAIELASENDIVLILGKGNETYEKLSTGTIYFNDEEEAMAAIKEKLETKKLTLK